MQCSLRRPFVKRSSISPCLAPLTEIENTYKEHLNDNNSTIQGLLFEGERAAAHVGNSNVWTGRVHYSLQKAVKYDEDADARAPAPAPPRPLPPTTDSTPLPLPLTTHRQHPTTRPTTITTTATMTPTSTIVLLNPKP